MKGGILGLARQREEMRMKAEARTRGDEAGGVGGGGVCSELQQAAMGGGSRGWVRVQGKREGEGIPQRTCAAS